MTTLDIRVNGIPCKAEVLHYTKPTRDTWEQPGDREEIEFELQDQRGRRAKWLDKYINEEVEMAVLAAYIEHCADYFMEPEYD